MRNLLASPDITFQNLRCVMKVAELGSVSRAAEEIARSQTAVTKAIHKVEKSIGISLFDRSNTGMWPTAEGELLASRISNAQLELMRSARFYQNHVGFPVDVTTLPVFNMGIRKQSLASFVCVFNHRDMNKAAEALELSLTTVQRAIRELEAQLKVPLFERAAAGRLMPTLVATEIARGAKLAFAEIGSGLDEIRSLGDQIVGHIRIGSLPFVRKEILPQAVVRLATGYPGISISTNEADYDAQEAALRSGELDLIVGPSSVEEKDVDLVAEPFMEMTLRFVVREEHPLARRSSVTAEEFSSLGWVLPPKGTAHRDAFDNFIKRHSVDIKGQVVETSLYSAARGIVGGSDLALISRQNDSELGSFVALEPDFVTSADTDGLKLVSHIVTRRRTTMSPAVRLFISMFRESVDGATEKDRAVTVVPDAAELTPDTQSSRPPTRDLPTRH
ncbi:MAG: LysR family transcriptional regulator [Pseudomonadota bacterium]